MKDLVVGIDSSTQSTKAIAWNRKGEWIAEGRSPIDLQNPVLSWFEQNSQNWWDSCRLALKKLFEQVDAVRVAGISFSAQRETVAFMDKDGKEVRPAIVWIDERSSKQVYDLSEELGADLIHDITGRPPGLTPSLYKFAWLKENEPASFEKTAIFTDVQAYLIQKLAGVLKTSWFGVDPLGCFDIRKKEWSPLLLKYLDLTPSHFPEPFAPGTKLGKITAEAASKTGLTPGTPIFAGGGDGQCAALGTNCILSNQAYINLGTAVVSGVWMAECSNSRAWRTEISPTGEGYILETVLRSGAFLINWFVDKFLPGNRNEKDFFKNIEKKAIEIPIGSDGLMTLPYWSGVMDPHWNPNARGCFIGLSGGHRPAHIYRSILEGICLNQAQATAAMEKETALSIDRFVAIGGGASSSLWTQMLADSTGKKIAISNTVEASALGAAMIAGYGAGWYPSINAAAEGMCGKIEIVHPDSSKREIWDKLLDIYSALYLNNEETFNKLAKLAAGSSTL